MQFVSWCNDVYRTCITQRKCDSREEQGPYDSRTNIHVLANLGVP